MRPTATKIIIDGEVQLTISTVIELEIEDIHPDDLDRNGDLKPEVIERLLIQQAVDTITHNDNESAYELFYVTGYEIEYDA